MGWGLVCNLGVMRGFWLVYSCAKSGHLLWSFLLVIYLSGLLARVSE